MNGIDYVRIVFQQCLPRLFTAGLGEALGMFWDNCKLISTGFTYERSSPHPNGTLASPLAARVDFVLATLGDAVEFVGLADVVAAVSAMMQ